MRYILFFCGTQHDQRDFEAMSEEALNERYSEVGRWFAEHGAKITNSHQLRPPRTATTVRFKEEGQPVVTNGPYIAGNEIIGGYAAIEVADLDEALRMAKTWPGRGVVEIRPVVEH